MPIFEYRCERCQNKFEILIVSGDVEEIFCPVCKSKEIEKRFSVFGVRSGGSSPKSTSTSSCSSCKATSCATCH